jgi:hypothetical protein
MVLSKRERIIAVVAFAAVAVLVLDHYALSPLLDASARLDEERTAAEAELGKSTTLFHRQDVMAHKWKDMVTGGLKSDPAEAEGQVLHALQGWADQARLSLASVKPERSMQGEELREITVQTSGTGSMDAVSRFLYLIDESQLPLRIKDLQLGARREGTDDLSLQVRVSTLYLAQPAKAPAAPATEKTTETRS